MIARVVAWSVAHRAAVVILSLALAIAGLVAARAAPLDAIPDLSDTQVIVATEWMGRSPDLVDDQVTFPLSTALAGVSGVRTVRGQSMFGMSFVYAIFEEGTSPERARTRVGEAVARVRLPAGANARLGADASGVGWVYQYALTGPDTVALRVFQETTLRPALQSLDGVAEVATVGGRSRQVEVSLDPDRMRARGVSFAEVAMAVAEANVLAGGGSVEIAGHEQMIRTRSEARTLDDLAEGAIAGRGVRIREVADVQWAPAPQRGVADLDGRGDTVGGIVVSRQGQNALDVIERVEARLAEVPLPDGARLVPVYDRSGLIRDAVRTLLRTLAEELIVVSVVVFVFLRHWRSALVPVVALPVAVIAAFVPLWLQGLTVNIMSLGGIAVAVGAMVDASILLVENVHARLATNPRDPKEAVLRAMQEVAPSAFFALAVIAVSFVPVFALQEAEGRLFRPLAWTKTWAMAFAAVLAVTLAPALMSFVHARTASVDRLSGFLAALYAPVVRLVVRARLIVVTLAALLVAGTLPVLISLPGEFMPPLQEGTLLYMPTAPPGISEGEASRVLTAMDAQIATVPEVATVFGKMGRADTATDPAPLSMAETVIQLKPRSQWREGMTWEGLVRDLDQRLQVPGMPNAWWMPVQTRTEMLATGIRSPLGLKVFGASLADIEAAAVRIEALLAGVPGTRSIYADRAAGGFYADVNVRRGEAAALGVTAMDVARTLEGALAGERVGDWLAGRERAPLVVRYARDFRGDADALGAALVDRMDAPPVALSTVADVAFTQGPDMLRSEDGALVGYVFVDPGDRPVTAWVADARKRLVGVPLGEGIRTEWAGTFQSLERANARLAWMVPLTLLAIALLIHASTRSWVETGIVMAAVPFSLVGAVWLLWALDYHLSVAVWVGMIALAGLDAETGVVMMLYLTISWRDRDPEGDPVEAIVDGAARRIRPKLMTVATAMCGLLPVFWSDGAGADVMRRIAAPMVGGLVSSFALELLVYPAAFAIWKRVGATRAASPPTSP